MLWSDHDKTFSDFFDSVFYSNDMPYTKWHVIYPPLATAIYDIIGNFIVPFVDMGVADPSHALRDSQMGLMIYVLLTVVTAFAIHIIFRRVLGNNDIRAELIFLLVILSYPALYAIERGNNVLVVAVLCILFLLCYNSENRKIRYLSFIFLSIAVGLKIYPLLFGLLILREKRYKEAALCALIGICFLLLPFFVTDGNIFILIENIGNYLVVEAPFGFINLDQFLRFMLNRYMQPGDLSIIVYVLTAMMYLIVFYVIMLNRDIPKWKIVAMLSCAIILGPGIGTQYLFVYMIIPLLFFLNEERDMSRWNLFYLICLVMILALIPGIYFSNGAITVVISSLKSGFVFLMMLGLTYEGFISHLLKRKPVAEQTEAL